MGHVVEFGFYAGVLFLGLFQVCWRDVVQGLSKGLVGFAGSCVYVPCRGVFYWGDVGSGVLG